MHPRVNNRNSSSSISIFSHFHACIKPKTPLHGKRPRQHLGSRRGGATSPIVRDHLIKQLFYHSLVKNVMCMQYEASSWNCSVVFFFMLEVEILSSKNGTWVSMDDGPNLLGRTNLWPEALEGHWLVIPGNNISWQSYHALSCSHTNTRVHMVPNLWSL